MPQGQKQWHPYSDFRAEKHLGWEMVFKCKEFLAEKASVDHCKCIIKNRQLQCSCFEIFRNNPDAQEAVALFMVEFFQRPKTAQQLTIMDWIKYSNNGKDKFLVPFLNPEEADIEFIDADTARKNTALETLSTTRICRSAIGYMLDWGRGKWNTCTTCLKNNTSPRHKLTGKRPNAVKAFDETTIKEDIDEFFEEMKELSQPQSTRIMREETGVGLRDGEEGVVELPPTFTKRTLYYRFCLERGWKVSLKPNTVSILQCEPLEDFEGDPLFICSWKYFLMYWKQNHSNVKIVSRTADVCTKCHVFRNRLRYVRYESTTEPGTNVCRTETSMKRYYVETSKKKKQNNEITEEPTNPDIVTIQRNNDEVTKWKDKDIYSPLVMEEETALVENSKILDEGSLHVRRAADQRKLCNEKIEQANNDFVSNVPHGWRRYCLVVDYCQNAQLPNLGATQPGETYYMTPLTVPILGIVDCSLKGGSLDAFVYHEGIGTKGGDNVASMILMLLKKKQWLKEEEAGGELSILMDNCGGQNKNNSVLRLANLLVEGGFFKKVNFVFYVVGHTKNVCDRWFNTMKKDYRSQNLYTFAQLCKALQTNERITVHPVEDGEFKEFRTFENLLYKGFRTGSIQVGHMFTVESNAPTLINISQDRFGTAPIDVQDLQKKSANIVDREAMIRKALIDYELMEVIPPTGIKEIKQIELWEKWRKLVPKDFADIICPYPGDEVMKRHKEERNRKAREKQQSKRRADGRPAEKRRRTEGKQ